MKEEITNQLKGKQSTADAHVVEQDRLLTEVEMAIDSLAGKLHPILPADNSPTDAGEPADSARDLPMPRSPLVQSVNTGNERIIRILRNVKRLTQQVEI